MVLVVSDCVGLGSDGSLCFSVVGFSVVVSNSAVVSDRLKGLVVSGSVVQGSFWCFIGVSV